jgi:hypothetical protein
MTEQELMDQHGVAVKNAGKLGHFKAPDDWPPVVDIEED